MPLGKREGCQTLANRPFNFEFFTSGWHLTLPVPPAGGDTLSLRVTALFKNLTIKIFGQDDQLHMEINPNASAGF